MKQNPYKRLFRYSLEYKWSFLLSIVGFITFAMADIAAVEWIRQIIGFIQNSDSELQQFLALSLIIFHESVLATFILSFITSPC